MNLLVKVIYFQIALLGILTANVSHNAVDLVLFENVNYKGVSNFVFFCDYFKFKLKIIFLIGESFEQQIKPNICYDLPNEWQNRVSSILTIKCIAVFTEENCKFNKASQIFPGLAQTNLEVNFSYPNIIPSLTFYGSLYFIYFFIKIQKSLVLILLIYFSG